MKAWFIFRHSGRQVFGNLNAVLRISLLLFAVQFVVQVVVALAGQNGGPAPTTASAEIAAYSARALADLATLVVCLWVAVAWHRHILGSEVATGCIPGFEGMRMLAYLGTWLFILAGSVLCAVVCGLGLALPLLFLHKIFPPIGVPPFVQFIPLLSILAMSGLSLRLFCILPGVALAPGHRLGEAWRATHGEAGTFYMLELVGLLGILLLGSANFLAFTVLGPLALIVAIVEQWVAMKVGISILTTLYDHYIQKRELI